jgi:hypothetical protein
MDATERELLTDLEAVLGRELEAAIEYVFSNSSDSRFGLGRRLSFLRATFWAMVALVVIPLSRGEEFWR